MLPSKIWALHKRYLCPKQACGSAHARNGLETSLNDLLLACCKISHMQYSRFPINATVHSYLGYHISPIHRIFLNNSVNILSLLASHFFPTLPHVTTHFSISTSVHMVAFNVSKTSTRDKSHTYMFRNTVEEFTVLLQVKGLGVLEPQK